MARRTFGLLAAGFAAALVAAPGAASAQWTDPDAGAGLDTPAFDPGPLARDPVNASLRELRRECGAATLPEDDQLYADFTGDGREDVILRIAAPCRGLTSYFCGSAGCRTDIWAARPTGGYVLTNTLTAGQAEIIPWYDGVAVQFDRGPVWVWSGTALERVRAPGVAGGPEGRAPWEDDTAALDDPETDGDWTDPGETEAPAAPPPRPVPSVSGINEDDVIEERGAPGIWRLEPRRAGGVRAVVDGRDGSRLVLSCQAGDDTLRLGLFARPGDLDRLPVTATPQLLIDFLVDRRVVETRILSRPQARGPLLEPTVVARGGLTQALARGGRFSARNGADGRILADIGLRASRRVLDLVRTACRL